LTSDPTTHVDVSVSPTRASWIDVQTNSSLPYFAISTSAARDVEGNRNEVTNIKKFNIIAFLNDLAGDFVAENHSNWRRCSATDHVLITSTDIRRNNLQNDRVFKLSATVLHSREIDISYFDFSGPQVRHPAIFCHFCAPLIECGFEIF